MLQLVRVLLAGRQAVRKEDNGTVGSFLVHVPEDLGVSGCGIDKASACMKSAHDKRSTLGELTMGPD